MTDQKAFIEKLKGLIPRGENLVDHLMPIISMSKQGTYKKIQATTKLSFLEIRDICLHFNISFDQFIGGSNSLVSSYSFYSDALRFAPTDYVEYWENMHNHLKKVSQLNNVHAYYLCNEVPFFYYIQFPHLRYFKLYMWNKISWGIAPLHNAYSPNLFNKKKRLIETIEKVAAVYNQYTSTEIWNPDILRLSMLQLTYSVKSGFFDNKEDLISILDDLDKMVQHMERVANRGEKVMFGSNQYSKGIDIYVNETVINSEVILITSDEYRIIYNKYDAPNYIRSDDIRVCDHAEIWMDQIISRSTRINKIGQGERSRFFKGLYSDLDDFKIKIISLYNSY